jgi:hypothetical protein
MHIYPIHDMVMAVLGGMCGTAVTAAIMDVKRTIHTTSEKDELEKTNG